MTYPNNKEAAIALAETMMAYCHQFGPPPTLCVILRREGNYQVLPLTAAKIAMGDWFLTNFKRIKWVTVTGHEPRC
jgi:hypothetical protein